MVAIRYYRQYLWIFFYLFFFLMAGALAMDSYFVISSSQQNGQMKLSRFLNVLVCFSFAGLAIVLQHFSSRGILGLRFLYDRKRWVRKKMRVKRKSYRKVAKRKNFILFYFINSFSNILVLVPLVIVFILQVTGLWDSIRGSWFHEWFFCVGILIKYVS